VKILHDGRGACGACENVYPRHFLIVVKGKVGKRNYELYARAYHHGYQNAKSGSFGASANGTARKVKILKLAHTGD
jgi:hypothetical protein